MDFDDIDNTLKELDDLDSDLFQDFSKGSKKKTEARKATSPKKQISEAIAKEPDDEFDDDDIADLLSDDDDVFSKSKAAKPVSNAVIENKKFGKQSLSTSRSFDSLDDDIIPKQSPKHNSEGKGALRNKDKFSKDDFTGTADFSKEGLNAKENQDLNFLEDILSPKKTEASKGDLDFLKDKEDNFKSETPSQNIASQKKKDEVNFDDSELLDDLGLDDLTSKPSKVKTTPSPSEKKGSFMDDLFGSSKKEQNISSRKTQEFALDEKYKSTEKKDDADAFGFGSYVPSSAAASGPTPRRKSVKFDDESILPRSGPSGGRRRKNFSKQDSFLDDLMSPENKGKSSLTTQRSSANEDLTSKTKSGALSSETLQSKNAIKESGEKVSSDTTSPSKGRDRNMDWLGFLKDDDKEKGQQSLSKDKSLDFLDKSVSKDKDDVLGQRRRSSGADWLGLGKAQSNENSEAVGPSPTRAKANVPSQQPSFLGTADSRGPEPRQMQTQMQSAPQVKESDSSHLSQLVSFAKMPPPSVDTYKGEVHPVIHQQPSAVSFDLQGGAMSNIPVANSPSMLQHASTNVPSTQIVNANIPSVHQYAAVETQNNFIAFQSMISSLQLEKEQLSKSIEALKARHEEEIKAIESSQRNQMKTSEESFKNQEKRLKEEYEAKIQNLASQVKDLGNEKADIVTSHKEKLDVLKNDHQQEVQRLKSLHSQAISTMKEDHENALSRLRQLKDQEVEAISGTQVYARSLQHLTDQLEARASDLAALQLRVDERHQKSLQERQNILDAKDKELKELKKKLDRQLEESEEERTRLQQLVLRLESRLQQITKDSEEEKWNLQQIQAKLEIKKKMLDEEQNQALQKIEKEKEKIKLSQETLLQEQKTVLLQLAQERQQLSSEKAELDLLSKRLREEEARLQSARLKGEANVEAERRSLLREKENIEMERSRIRQESQQLQLDREEIERDRRQLQDGKEKYSDQKYSLQRQTQEIEEMSQNAKRMKEEAKMMFSSANKVVSDRSAQLEQINQQLSALHAKETQILMEKSSLAEERKALEMKKDSLLCVNCKLSLSRPFTGFTSDVTVHQIPAALSMPHVRAVTGIQNIQNAASVDPSLLWWYITAQKDKDYLTNEQLFLQSLQEPTRKKFV